MKNNWKLLFASLCTLGLLAGCTARNSSQPSSNTEPTSDTSGSGGDTSSESENPHDRDPDDPYRILFLGNSLVFFNDMPKTFEAMTRAQGIPVYVEALTQGSCTMSLFASTTVDIGYQANYKLTTEEWDYVIIEPSRRATPFEDTVFNAELDAAEVLDELIQGAGGETVIYSVWGLNKGTTGVYQQNGIDAPKIGEHEITRSAHCNYMNYFGEAVSRRLGGRKIIRAGYAYENCIAQHPLRELNIYHTDEQHPSPAGSYLIACTIYDTIFGEAIGGTRYTGSIDSTVAVQLQDIADATMMDGVVPTLDPIPWPTDDPITPPDPVDDVDQRVLLIGAPNILRDSYSPAVHYSTLMENCGKTVYVDSVLDSSYTMNEMTSEEYDKGAELRNKLASAEFDAIIIQISRRMTPNSTEVNASEMAAAAAIAPLLKAETENVYVFAPRGSSSQKDFALGGVNYTETSTGVGKNYTEMSAFYTETAEAMATAMGVKSMDFASAWVETFDAYQNAGYGKITSDANKPATSYLYACCFYYRMFEEAIPATCTWQNDLTDVKAEIVRTAAAHYCLPTTNPAA